MFPLCSIEHTLAFTPPAQRWEVLHEQAVFALYPLAGLGCVTALFLITRDISARPWSVRVVYFSVVVAGLAVIVANGPTIACRYNGDCQ